MVQAQAGDRTAFSQLAAAVADRLYAVAFRMLRDPDAAQDATQQAIVSIWRKVPRLKDPDRFETWSYRILLRACYEQGRLSRRRGPDPHDLQINDGRRDVAAVIADRDQLERGFRRLTKDQRAAIVLQHYLGYSLPQIAELLEIPVGTVGSRIHAAKRALRAALEADARPGLRKDVPA